MGIKSKESNKDKAYAATFVIIIINIITIILPIFFLQIFPTSSITKMFFSFPWCFLIVFGVVFSIYFIFTGIYYFDFKSDKYIIEIRSRRTISSYLSSKTNYLEMPISSIDKFSFFNRPFSLNTTLMVKVKVSHKRAIAKRFNLSFLNKKQKDEISNILEEIIKINHLNG